MELSAKDVVADIKAGMTRVELAKKYRLSSKGLSSLFRKLIRARAVSRSEIERLNAASDAAEQENRGSDAFDFDRWAASFDQDIDLQWNKSDPDLH